jgi:hypothetical protein
VPYAPRRLRSGWFAFGWDSELQRHSFERRLNTDRTEGNVLAIHHASSECAYFARCPSAARTEAQIAGVHIWHDLFGMKR